MPDDLLQLQLENTKLREALLVYKSRFQVIAEMHDDLADLAERQQKTIERLLQEREVTE